MKEKLKEHTIMMLDAKTKKLYSKKVKYGDHNKCNVILNCENCKDCEYSESYEDCIYREDCSRISREIYP